jgi:hypothetical protein
MATGALRSRGTYALRIPEAALTYLVQAVCTAEAVLCACSELAGATSCTPPDFVLALFKSAQLDS